MTTASDSHSQACLPLAVYSWPARCAMDLSFGARLRLQRERQQVALAAIAADTKIKLSLLEALERDDVSQWPAGIFRRAYVRSYARSIGLEPDTVVREFLELHPDPVDMIPTGSPPPPNTDRETANAQPATRLRRLVSSAMAAVPIVLQRAQTSEPNVTSTTAAAPHDVVERHPVSPAPTLSASTRADSPVTAEPRCPEPDRAARAFSEPRLQGETVRPELSLSAAAHLCTRLGQLLDTRELATALEDAATILDAVGLIVWSWDPRATALRASLAHGYSTAALARLPTVARDASNAVAAAFRSAEPCVVTGGDGLTGAVVVPLMGPSGCAGVLALELRNGGEQRESVRAFATILAAQLATLLGSPPLAPAVGG